MGLFVLAYEVLFSADIGQSLKILLYYTYLSVDILRSRSTLTAWLRLAIHPGVRANRALIGLGCCFKKIGPLKLFLFCKLETNNSIFDATE